MRQGCGQRRDTSGGMEMPGTVGSGDTLQTFQLSAYHRPGETAFWSPFSKKRVTFKSVRITEASNCSHTPSKYGRRWSTEG